MPSPLQLLLLLTGCSCALSQAPLSDLTQNSSCHRGPWRCQQAYKTRVGELPAEESRCNLSRSVRCERGPSPLRWQETVRRPDEQALLGISCPWVRRDFSTSQSVYRCSRKPLFNRSVHPVAAWCPWSFWTDWKFECRDQAVSRMAQLAVDIPSKAIGVWLSTRERECRCPQSPGVCSPSESSELRWSEARQSSGGPLVCSWCAWEHWTSDCACSIATHLRTRYRDCVCSNGSIVKPERSNSVLDIIVPPWHQGCFGIPVFIDPCYSCRNILSAPDYPKDSSTGYRPPARRPADSGSSGSIGGENKLLATLAIPILTIMVLVYCVKKRCFSRSMIINEPVAVHLIATSAAASDRRPLPVASSPPPPPLPPPQPDENSAPPPSYEEAVRCQL